MENGRGCRVSELLARCRRLPKGHSSRRTFVFPPVRRNPYFIFIFLQGSPNKHCRVQYALRAVQEYTELYSRRGSGGRRGEPLLFTIASHHPRCFGCAGYKLISHHFRNESIVARKVSVHDLSASERRLMDEIIVELFEFEM